ALATLLDLVARGVLVVEHDPRGITFLRAVPARFELRTYERHVWNQVVSGGIHGGGRTPADRLDSGSSQHAKVWYERFTEALEADGRERGLVAARVPIAVRVLLW